MELLKSELSMILGKPISRIETLNCQSHSCLYALYDPSGNALPLAVRYFSRPGYAEQEARKLMLLRQQGGVRVPQVYGVVVSERPPFHELLLLERIGGLPVEAPPHSGAQWQTLVQQVIEAMMQWHSHSANGMSGYIDSSQTLSWPDWFFQYSSVLLSLLRHTQQQDISPEELQFLHLTQRCHDKLFADLRAENVMVHGNLRLNTLLKDPRSGQLLAIVQPGRVLWAPAEYELFHLQESSAGQQIVSAWLRQFTPDEGFLWRSALYRLWYQVEQRVHNQPFSAENFRNAITDLRPWLE